MALAGLRPNTINARQVVLRMFLAHIHPRGLNKATQRDVESFLGRKLAPASRRAYRNHLHAYYRWAVENDYVTDDPTAKIPRIKVRQGLPRPLPRADFALALDNANLRMRAWLLLMGMNGLRCVEVSLLQPGDLALNDRQVWQLFLREEKGGGQGLVPAHPAVVEALTALPQRNGLWWSISPKSISAEVARFLRGLGIDAGAHRLRHTSATAVYEWSGHDLLATAQLMRHTQVSSTMIYAKVDPARPAEIMSLLPLPTGGEAA